MYSSTSGLTVTKHAIDRWCERSGRDLFYFETTLLKAMRLRGVPLYLYRSSCILKSKDWSFVLEGRVVVTCYIKAKG